MRQREEDIFATYLARIFYEILAMFSKQLVVLDYRQVYRDRIQLSKPSGNFTYDQV
jgi:hypothetical protein